MELYRETDEDLEVPQVKTSVCDIAEGKQSIFEELDSEFHDTLQQIENYKRSKQTNDDCDCSKYLPSSSI